MRWGITDRYADVVREHGSWPLERRVRETARDKEP